MSKRSKKHGGDLGYVATRKGDAVRVDEYMGRRKVKNYAFYLDATKWPASRVDQLNMARWLLGNPTLLKGPSLRDGDATYAQIWRNAEDVTNAINEVMNDSPS